MIVGTRPEAIRCSRSSSDSSAVTAARAVRGEHRSAPGSGRFVLENGGIKADVDLSAGSEPRTLNGLVAAIVTGVEAVVEDLRAADPDQDIPSQPQSWFTETPAIGDGRRARVYPGAPPGHPRRAGCAPTTPCRHFPRSSTGNSSRGSRASTSHPRPRTWANLAGARSGDSGLRDGQYRYRCLQWAADMQTPFDDPRLEDLVESDHPVIVVTAHRRENWEADSRGSRRRSPKWRGLVPRSA